MIWFYHEQIISDYLSKFELFIDLDIASLSGDSHTKLRRVTRLRIWNLWSFGGDFLLTINLQQEILTHCCQIFQVN